MHRHPNGRTQNSMHWATACNFVLLKTIFFLIQISEMFIYSEKCTSKIRIKIVKTKRSARAVKARDRINKRVRGIIKRWIWLNWNYTYRYPLQLKSTYILIEVHGPMLVTAIFRRSMHLFGKDRHHLPSRSNVLVSWMVAYRHRMPSP